MRILVLANAMNTLSGGDKRFIEIFRRLKKQGHFIRIMLPREGYEICKNETLNVSYQILPALGFSNFGPILSNFLRLVLGCIFVVRNFGRFDVVYSSSDFLSDTIPAFLLRLIDKQVRWVAVTHYLVPAPSERDGNPLVNFVSFFTQRISVSVMKRFANLIITSSMWLKLHLVSLGVCESKIQVGSNGVDTKLIDGIRAGSLRRYDACFAARLHPSKGIYDVIDVWDLVCGKKPAAKLVMVGYGKKMIVDELRSRIVQKGLSKNVELIGFRRSSGVYEFMKQSKLFLYADTENGWGIAVAEAMASKCVAIAYDLPVYKEVFNGAIVYVPLRNINKFAEAVLSLLSNERLIHKMAEQSRTFISKYDWDLIASGELKNIRGVISHFDANHNLGA